MNGLPLFFSPHPFQIHFTEKPISSLLYLTSMLTS